VSKKPKEFADPIDEVLHLMNKAFRTLGYKTVYQVKKRQINFREGAKAANHPPMHCRISVESPWDYKNHVKQDPILKFGHISANGSGYRGARYKMYKLADMTTATIHHGLDPVKIVEHCDKVMQYLSDLPNVFHLEADPDDVDEDELEEDDSQ
jgi:hypothetical protein